MPDLFDQYGINDKPSVSKMDQGDLFDRFGIKDVPQMAEQSFLEKIKDYGKGGALGQLQGIGDMAASVGNFPADIYKYFKGTQPYEIPHPSLRQYYPESSAGQIGSHLGELGSSFAGPGGAGFGAAKMVGNPLMKIILGSMGGALGGAAADDKDRIMGGLEGAALGTIPGIGSSIAATGRGIGKFATGLKPTDVAPLIQKAHDISLENAVAPLNMAAYEAALRKAPSIRLDESILDRSRAAFPKTEKYKSLLEDARLGSHKGIRDLQTDLGHVERELLSEGTNAATKYGQELGQLRKDINNRMFKTYEAAGHKDLADMIRQGMTDYEKHAGLFYENPTINKLVGKNKLVTENLISKINENSVPMEEFRQQIPGLKKKLSREELRRKILKTAKIGGPIGVGVEAAREWYK